MITDFSVFIPRLAFYSLVILHCNITQAQILEKSTNWLLHHSIIDTTTPGQPSFRIYPTLAYAPETALEIGLSTLYLFQAKKDSNNRISELNAFTFFTLQSQYGVWLENAIYGHKDKWFILGRIRVQRFPLLHYGVGPKAVEHYPATIDANYLIFRQRVLRKIAPNLFLGPEVDYQNLSNSHVEHHKDDPVKDFPLGSLGSSNVGLGGAIVYDNRHNVLNVRKGHFAEVGLLTYSDKFGSKYSFTGINADFRTYQPINGKDVLALHLTSNFYKGDVPFNQMALMGGEIMMRGYYYGRYRDKNMLAGQAEYRILPFSFSKRIGAAVFASTAVVAPTIDNLRFDNLKLAGGGGIRYLLFPKKDIFVRFDVGVTKERIGFYFFTGEAF
jgi:hypothetical protein